MVSLVVVREAMAELWAVASLLGIWIVGRWEEEEESVDLPKVPPRAGKALAVRAAPRVVRLDEGH